MNFKSFLPHLYISLNSIHYELLKKRPPLTCQILSEYYITFQYMPEKALI